MTRKRKVILFGGFIISIALLLIAGFFVLRSDLARRFTCLPNNGAPYTATDLDGRVYTSQTLFNKPTLLFFGYTYCPEICPTTLGDISRWMEKLGGDADKIKVIFVTVDPERDTPKELKTYLSSFDKHIEGIILTPHDLAVMTKAYNIYYEKEMLENGEYSIAHDTVMLLLDPDGHVVDRLGYQASDEEAMARLQKLANNTSIDWSRRLSLSGCKK